MDWTYSTTPGADNFVSDLLDFYGYLIYLSPLIAFLPGVIFKIISNLTGSKFKGDFYGLVTIMIRVVI